MASVCGWVCVIDATEVWYTIYTSHTLMCGASSREVLIFARIILTIF